VTHPGIPVSPGRPPLEEAARSAIQAAQERLGVLTRGNPFPQLPKEEREKVLEDAEHTVCKYCTGWHEGASTPGCPRIAKCKMNADGTILEVEFWPDGQVTSTIETDGDGKTRTVIHSRTDNWDTSRVVRVQDAAEEDGEEAQDGDH
jgi:hypothetical protein